MALLLALTSIAQTPRTTGSSAGVPGRFLGDVDSDGEEADMSIEGLGGGMREELDEVGLGTVV
jgi:hypothetical protein